MTSAEAVTRARSACGQGCTYVLGKGGMRPDRPFPWAIAEDVKQCDCSGFAMWVLGLSRKVNGLWYDTTRIVSDSKGEQTLFEARDSWVYALPGDLLVWGDKGKSQGHVGVVTEVDGVGPIRVAHCSSGNYRTTLDAIRETDPGIFARNGAIAVRFKALSG